MNASPTPTRRLRATAALVSVLAVPAVAGAATIPAQDVADGFGPGPGQAAAPLTITAPPPTLQRLLRAERRLARRAALEDLQARRARREARVARRAGALVAHMKQAGDRIATRPYVYGGGHGSFRSRGYDCSGSVSYVLHAAGLLDRPLASGGLAAYGEPGPGRRVSIYANGGHVYLTIDGRRFDTSAIRETGGTRWTRGGRPSAGYTVRHPAGL